MRSIIAVKNSYILGMNVFIAAKNRMFSRMKFITDMATHNRFRVTMSVKGDDDED